MQPERFATLIEKYSSGTISTAEIDELNAWYREKAYQDAAFPDEEQAVEQRMLARLNRAIAPPKRRARYGGWYAAAAALLVVTGAWFLFRPSPKPATPVVAARPQTTQTNSNKAILTLAGGKRIVLDSAHAGMLATEGGSTVTKTVDGNIMYAAGQGNKVEAAFNTLSTPNGGQYHLTLPDGTRVWLNAASGLTYPTAFNGGERLVKLTGEAYFEIAEDHTKPFKVEVPGRQQVIVLGTHFNIEAYPEEDNINTTLLQGAVKLVTRKQQLLLKPGETAVNNPAGKIQTKHADEEAVMAWKNGLFVFNDESMKTAMQKLARWYDVEVEYRDDVHKKRLGGVIPRLATLNELLDKITKANGIHYEIKGRRVVLMK